MKVILNRVPTLLLFLFISKNSFTQSSALKYDKEVIAISKAIANNKEVSKWKGKTYYPSVSYIKRIYGNFGFKDSLLDMSRMKKPDDNTLIVTYLLFHLDMMDFEKTGKNEDSLCRKKLEIVTAEEALFRYYEYVFMSVFSTTIPTNKDLSKIDFDLDALGLKSNTEKMIFFISGANRLTNGIDIFDRRGEKLEENINYVGRCPTFNKYDFMNFPLLEYKNFEYNGSTFSYKIEQYNYVKSKYSDTYEVQGER